MFFDPDQLGLAGLNGRNRFDCEYLISHGTRRRSQQLCRFKEEGDLLGDGLIKFVHAVDDFVDGIRLEFPDTQAWRRYQI